MRFFDLFGPKVIQDVHIELPSAVTVEFNHRLKLAFAYHDDPDLDNSAYDEIEAHLKKRGYVLLVIKAPVLNRHR